MARPTDYSEDIADSICERIADGKSLRAICLSDDMPARSTVFRWLSLHQEFSDRYARAREEQADVIFDEILEIADESGKDIKTDADGVERTDNEAIQRSRLRVDARKWMAGKLRPKKYGEKLELSGDADAPLNIKVTIGGDGTNG